MEEHRTVLLGELIRSQEILGSPFYRSEQWAIEDLDAQGTLVLRNDRHETVAVPDGEELKWPLFSVD